MLLWILNNKMLVFNYKQVEMIIDAARELEKFGECILWNSLFFNELEGKIR